MLVITDPPARVGAAWFCAAVLCAVLNGVVATHYHRQFAHSPPRKNTGGALLKGGSPNDNGTGGGAGKGKSWPVPSQDDGWSVCGTHTGMLWQTVVPLLLLTGAGAVLAASFSPLVVWPCRLTVSKPVLKAPLVSALETKIS